MARSTRVEATAEIDASLADVWELYFDRDRWASWVDGFGVVVSSSGYPDRSGELVWRSTAAGRGQVSEDVLEHAPRSLHRIAFEDPESTGELETTFAILPADQGRRTRVRLRLTYALSAGGPLRAITDLLFIRPQMRGSLERSLAGLAQEAAASAGED